MFNMCGLGNFLPLLLTSHKMLWIEWEMCLCFFMFQGYAHSKNKACFSRILYAQGAEKNSCHKFSASECIAVDENLFFWIKCTFRYFVVTTTHTKNSMLSRINGYGVHFLWNCTLFNTFLFYNFIDFHFKYFQCVY